MLLRLCAPFSLLQKHPHSLTQQQQPSPTPGPPTLQQKQNKRAQLNFVPTHHWLPPRYGRGVDAGVGSFCAMDGTNGAPTCIPWTKELIEQFRDSMVVCFREAFKNGLTISIRPHLDDGSPDRNWRNGLTFSPLAKVGGGDGGGFSYYDIMLVPLAQAVRIALEQSRADRWPGAPKPKVYFSLQVRALGLWVGWWSCGAWWWWSLALVASLFVSAGRCAPREAVCTHINHCLPLKNTLKNTPPPK
jgi:hypothetical protein